MLRGRRTIPIQRQRRSPFRFVFTWKQIWAIRNSLTIVRGCGCINKKKKKKKNGTWLGLTYKWLWLFLGLTKHQTAIHEGKTCKAPKKKNSSTKQWQSSRFKYPIQIWDPITRHTKRQCTYVNKPQGGIYWMLDF